MRLAPASPIPATVPPGWFLVVSLRGGAAPADWSLMRGDAVSNVAPWPEEFAGYPRSLVTVGVLTIVVDMSAAEVLERVEATRKPPVVGVGMKTAIRAAAARGAVELVRAWRRR